MSFDELFALVAVLGAVAGGLFAWLRRRSSGERHWRRPLRTLARGRLKIYIACPAIGLAFSTAVLVITDVGTTAPFAIWVGLAAALAAALSLVLGGSDPRPVRTAVVTALLTLAAAALVVCLVLVVFAFGCLVLADEPCLT